MTMEASICPETVVGPSISGFLSHGGTPSSLDGLHGNSKNEMDWGYPHVRQPPFLHTRNEQITIFARKKSVAKIIQKSSSSSFLGPLPLFSSSCLWDGSHPVLSYFWTPMNYIHIYIYLPYRIQPLTSQLNAILEAPSCMSFSMCQNPATHIPGI